MAKTDSLTGDLDAEHGAFSHVALDEDFSTMGFRDHFADSESQSGSFDWTWVGPRYVSALFSVFLPRDSIVRH